MIATKSQSQKLWTSFGNWDELNAYLSEHEQLKLQKLNRFCYDVAVSRV